MITKVLKEVIEQAETWPQQDQEELAEYAREIQARRTGVYIMSDEERAEVRRGWRKLIAASSYPMKSWRKPTNATSNEGSVHPGCVRGLRTDLCVPAGTFAERRAQCDEGYSRRCEVAARSAYSGYKTDDPDVWAIIAGSVAAEDGLAHA